MSGTYGCVPLIKSLRCKKSDPGPVQSCVPQQGLPPHETTSPALHVATLRQRRQQIGHCTHSGDTQRSQALGSPSYGSAKKQNDAKKDKRKHKRGAPVALE